MSFNDCVDAALAGKEISKAEADRLKKAFAEFLDDEGRSGAGDPRARAKAALEEALRADQAEAQRVAQLAEQTRDRMLRDLDAYRDAKGRPDVLEWALRHLEHFGFTGFSSVEGRFKAIVAGVQSRMEEVLATFDRTAITGSRKEKPLMADVARVLFGQQSKDPRAVALANSLSDAFEELRNRANAAGMSISDLKGWGLPQHHDGRALVAAGLDQWKAFITLLLDRARMLDPLTGAVMGDARLSQFLDAAYKRIVSDGSYGVAPTSQAQGAGALWKQRNEHRFLHFSDADAWMKYADAFGQPDPFAASMMHIRGLSKDIAAMEVLGPNPDASISWLKSVVEAERAKFLASEPSLWRDSSTSRAFDRAGLGDHRIDSLWAQIRGGDVVNSRMAMGFASVRNLITSAVLGAGAVTAFATDPFVGNVAKRLSGLPQRFALTEMVRTFFGGQSRGESVRAGLILEDALHLMGEEARFAGSMGGATWTRWLADRTLTWSGLSPWTQARKHLFGMDFQSFMADNSGNDWAALPETLRRTMEGYGLDAADWASMRAAPQHAVGGSAGVLRPAEVEAHAGRDIAERYLEMLHGETERAVPSGTKRSRALMAWGKKGTVASEVVNGALQFKAFGLSFTTLQFEALSEELQRGRAAGAGYAGKLLLSLTLGGALAVQLKDMARGKDPMDMSDPKFWIKAAQTGGGFGIFGDFLFADASRMGWSLGEQIMGPTLGLATDVAKIPLAAFRKMAEGEETSVGKATVQMLRRYVPAASLWYLRAGYERVVADQLEYLASPSAHRDMRQREQRLRRDTGQESWWKPGRLLPDRAPDLTAASPL